MRLARSVTLLLVVVIATAGCATQPPVRVPVAPSEIKSSTSSLLVYKAPAKKSDPITLPETTVPLL
jgi:hypothetical protein